MIFLIRARNGVAVHLLIERREEVKKHRAFVFISK